METGETALSPGLVGPRPSFILLAPLPPAYCTRTCAYVLDERIKICLCVYVCQWSFSFSRHTHTHARTHVDAHPLSLSLSLSLSPVKSSVYLQSHFRCSFSRTEYIVSTSEDRRQDKLKITKVPEALAKAFWASWCIKRYYSALSRTARLFQLLYVTALEEKCCAFFP